MRTKLKGLIPLVVLGGMLALPATSWANEPLFRRATLSEGVWTQIEIGRQYEAPREIPIMDCIGEPFSCTSSVTFSQLYEIVASKVVESIAPDGTSMREEYVVRRERFATDLGPAAEEKLEELLKSYARSIQPQFADDPATLTIFGAAVPAKNLFDESKTPTWMCAENRTQVLDAIFLHPNKEVGYILGHAPEEMHESICNLLALNLDAGERETYLSPAGVGQLEVTSVHVSTILQKGSGDLAALTPIPAETGFTKEERESSDSTGSTGRIRDGVYEWRREDGRFEKFARFPPVRLAVPGASTALWAAHWEVATERQHFGPSYRSEVLDQQEVWIAMLPLEDGWSGTQALDLIPPVGDWKNEAREIWSTQAEFDALAFGQALRHQLVPYRAEPEMGLVVCFEDQATFSFAFSTVTAKIENGRDVCGAIRRLNFESSDPN